eukprot:gene28150-3894_t
MGKAAVAGPPSALTGPRGTFGARQCIELSIYAGEVAQKEKAGYKKGTCLEHGFGRCEASNGTRFVDVLMRTQINSIMMEKGAQISSGDGGVAPFHTTIEAHGQPNPMGGAHAPNIVTESIIMMEKAPAGLPAATPYSYSYNICTLPPTSIEQAGPGRGST